MCPVNDLSGMHVNLIRGGQRWALVVFGCLALGGFLYDLQSVMGGGSIDLRNRVVGMRLMAAQRDPYFYKWQAQDPPEWLDLYAAYMAPINRNTVTPAALMLFWPWQSLAYPAIQKIWVVVQWVCLLGALGLGARLIADRKVRGWFYLFGLIMAASCIWRLHVDRGQIYICFAVLLLAAAACFARGPAGSAWLAVAGGGLFGVLTAMRPAFILFLLPLFQLKRRGAVWGYAIGLGLAVITPCLLNHGFVWEQWRQAMSLQTQRSLQLARPPGYQAIVDPIEGVPMAIMVKYQNLPFVDCALPHLLNAAQWPMWRRLPLYLGWSIALGLVAWWAVRLYRRRHLDLAPLGLLAQAAAVCFIVDLCLAPIRISYNDVLILPVLALALAAWCDTPALVQRWLMLGLGLWLAFVAIGWCPRLVMLFSTGSFLCLAAAILARDVKATTPVG